MKGHAFILGALALAAGVAPLQAQTGVVRGRITDAASHEPIAGVTVTIGARGAQSQANGRFYIAGVPSGVDTIRARIIGYAPASEMVNVRGGDTTNVDLALTAQAIGLAELVVTGYGEQPAGDITGAVTQLSDSQFNPGRIISPQQLIESKVAGVQVVDNNEPGGGIAVRIRGATSINASSDPLYVVDGLPIGQGGGISAGRDPLNFLNPNDIETITVLKGGEASSIYGANAANGVVIITTKSGRSGPPQVEYSTSFSASSVTRLPSMLTPSQFTTAVNTYAPQNSPQLLTGATDWFGQVDRTGYGSEHNLAVSGAGQSNNYRLSLGYLNQDGIIKGTTAQRLSLGLDYAQRLFDDHLSVRTNLRGSRSVDQFSPGGVLSNAAQMGPTQPVFDSTSPTGFYNWPGNSLQSASNPVQILALAQDKGTTYRSIGNAQAAYHLPFLSAMTANLNVGYDYTTGTHDYFRNALLHDQLVNGNGGYQEEYQPNLLNTVMETYLNYAAPLRFMRGSIDLTGGYSYSQSHGEYNDYQANGLSTSLLTTNAFPAARTVANTLDIEDSKLISFFGRANYNLNDRYLVALSVRRDGSSRFGPSNAWGTFPSVAVAWRLSQESFLRGMSSLSDLKLRASWGITGNQQFNNYQQYAAYTVGSAQSQAQFGPGTFVTTLRPSAVDPNIKWEQTTSYNIGFDYGFHNQKYTGAVDWYNKSTKDLIFNVPVAAGSNFSNFLTTNIGSMKNTGVELMLNARLLEGGRHHGLGYTASFTAAHNTNQLTAINPTAGLGQRILTGGIAGGVGTTIQVLEPGQPINSFYVFQQKYDATGKPIQGSYADSAGCATPGTCAVPRAFHDPAPKWILGHSSYLSYGRWDFSATLRAYLGSYVYNNVASNLGTYSEVTRGSPYNLQSSVLTTGFTQPQYQSDYYVENGSFLRMDNITAGYSFNYHDKPMRVYVAVQNVFTITGYSGVDPTAGLNGIDNNIYPRARTVSGGLSVRL
ncbi:MAG TPA: SusC/RagA family TonB-linked outer membrane protein [Gemmatimonadales bacterium]